MTLFGSLQSAGWGLESDGNVLTETNDCRLPQGRNRTPLTRVDAIRGVTPTMARA